MRAPRRQREMKCFETEDSSSITRFCYDERNKVLVIQFKHGRVYNYYDVPQAVFEQMIAARSKGRFFVDNIKEEYDYTRG